MSSASHRRAHRQADRRGPGRRSRLWNLLLLVPLLTLVTPWFNADQPRFAGLPFFYWLQFLFVLVGVACVWIVATRTTKRSTDDQRSGGAS